MIKNKVEENLSEFQSRMRNALKKHELISFLEVLGIKSPHAPMTIEVKQVVSIDLESLIAQAGETLE